MSEKQEWRMTSDLFNHMEIL